MKDIAELFASLQFAKRIVGGVEERDVWKKLDEVQTAYRRVYEAQRERDLALILERDETIRKLSASLEQIKKLCGESAAGVEIPKAPAQYRDDESDVKGAALKPYWNDGSVVEGASREPDRDGEYNIEDPGLDRYRDSKPEVKGVSREPSRTKSSGAATKASPVNRGSIDSLSSDSSAEADLAFDWLDDGDFNL